MRRILNTSLAWPFGECRGSEDARGAWRELVKKGGTPMKKLLLWKGQKGQGLVEYSLIIALVAIVVIAILVLMGPQIGKIFSTITNGL